MIPHVAMREAARRIHAVAIERAFGQPGVDSFFHILETLWELYKHIELSRVEGMIVVFCPVGTTTGFATPSSGQACTDFSQLTNQVQTGLILEIRVDGSCFVHAPNGVDVEKVKHTAVVYQYFAKQELFLAGDERSTVIGFDPSSESQFAPEPVMPPKVEMPLAQSSIEFEVTNTVPRTPSVPSTPPPAPVTVVPMTPAPPPATEKIVHTLEPEPRPAAVAPNIPEQRTDRIAPAEHQMRVEDRIAKMRELTLKLRSPNGLADLEREPAYKRKNLTLTDGPRSTDSNVSRYTLSQETDENGEQRTEIKRNNPFLHNNVD